MKADVHDRKFVRSVGGEVISSFVADVKSTRFELLTRKCANRVHWHFRQPYLTLLWWRAGHKRLNATIDGRTVSHHLTGETTLGVFPPGTAIEAEFEVSPRCDYAIALIDPKFVFSRLQTQIAEPIAAFEHPRLLRGLTELCEEAATPDNVFNLFLEGWAIQAVGHIARASNSAVPHSQRARGGLTGPSIHRLDEYIRSNLAACLTLSDLANVSGFSKRHFVRAFSESFGLTPHQYVLSLRIDQARRRLVETCDDITEVALGCGFSNAQHFATRFRKVTGVAPSRYRRQRLSSSVRCAKR